MTTSVLAAVPTSTVIADVRQLLRGKPVFMAGSLVAADTYGMGEYHDVDLFCPTQSVLVSVGQYLIDNGYTLDDRFSRVWERWLRYGLKGWHTNSLRLMSPGGVETNLVYKLTEGHAATSLAEVLESFDFGLLGTGWDLEHDTFRDMRSYLFPDARVDDLVIGRLPMMPNKRSNWRQGFISQYNGLREMGRYAKYYKYGYPMDLIKDDLATGYRMAALYYSTGFKPEHPQMEAIYSAIAEHIELDHIDELELAAKDIDYTDSLDAIMEALE
jgi:hypothetical protein